MAEEQVELAAKDVFALLGVSIPENLEVGTKRQEQGDTKDDESVFTLEEDDKVQFMVISYLMVFLGGRVGKNCLWLFCWASLMS